MRARVFGYFIYKQPVLIIDKFSDLSIACFSIIFSMVLLYIYVVYFTRCTWYTEIPDTAPMNHFTI